MDGYASTRLNCVASCSHRCHTSFHCSIPSACGTFKPCTFRICSTPERGSVQQHRALQNLSSASTSISTSGIDQHQCFGLNGGSSCSRCKLRSSQQRCQAAPARAAASEEAEVACLLQEQAENVLQVKSCSSPCAAFFLLWRKIGVTEGHCPDFNRRFKMKMR